MKESDIQKAFELMDEYSKNRDLLYDFSNLVVKKLEIMAIENNVVYQHIKARVKKYDSLKNKLIDKGFVKKIDKIFQIDDLIGARIVFYLNEEVNFFSKVIRENFEILEVKSRIEIDENKNVYYSAEHFILKLKDTELNQERFGNLKFELQLVPVLYHAANEIGHDIFYKDKYCKNLKEKNPDMYEKMMKARTDAWTKVLEAQEDFEIINSFSQAIEDGYNIIQEVSSNDFLVYIDSINDFESANAVLFKLDGLYKFISTKEHVEMIKFDKIIEKLFLMFDRIKKIPRIDDDYIFDILNNPEYVYKNLLKIITQYIFAYPTLFEYMLEFLHKQSKEKESFKSAGLKSLKDVLEIDKRENIWNINNLAYQWILELKDREEYISEIVAIADECLNVRIASFNRVGVDSFSFAEKNIIPNEQLFAIQSRISDILLEMLIEVKNNKELISMIIHKARTPIMVNEEKKYLLLEKMLNFYNVNYEKIDMYYKLEVYNNIHFLQKDYEKALEDNSFSIFIKDETIEFYNVVFSYHDYSLTHSEFDKKREYISASFVENLNESDILKIANLISFFQANKMNNIESSCYKKIMFEIGKKNNKISTKILENIFEYGCNIEESLLLGLLCSCSQKNDFEKTYLHYVVGKNKMAVQLLTEQMYLEYNYELTKKIYHDFDGDINIKIEIMKLINRKKLWNKEFGNIFFESLSYLNKERTPFQWFGLYDNDQLKAKLSKTTIKLIFENLLLKETKIQGDILKISFEKFPIETRAFFEKMIENNKDFSMTELYWLKSVENFQVEYKNNVYWIINFIKKDIFSIYKMHLIVDNMLGEYTLKLESILLEFLDKDSNFETIYAVIKLLEMYDNFLISKNIVKKIITINNSDEVKECLGGVMHNLHTSGEYGPSEVTQKKIEELQIWLNDENQRIKEFASEQIKYLKNSKDRYDKETKMHKLRRIKEFEISN